MATDAKMGDLKKQKRAFHLILVAKYEVTVFREKASKTRGKRGSQHDPHIELWALRGLVFEFGRLFERSDC